MKSGKKERTVGLLNTHRVETHQHNLCFLITRQLQSGNNQPFSSPLIRSLNQRESLVIWSDSRVEALIISRTGMGPGRKIDMKTQLVSMILAPLRRCGEQTAQQHLTEGSYGTRNLCAGVNVSEESMGQDDTVCRVGWWEWGGWQNCKDVLWWGV